MTASTIPPRAVSAGKPYPVGATVRPDGVHFSLYSHDATAVELLLFDDPADSKAIARFALDRQENHTANYWHCFVPGIGAGQLYGYRVYGPYDPPKGHRFDPSKLLVDPYARAVVDDHYERAAALRLGAKNTGQAIKSVVVDPDDYDWEGDAPLNRELRGGSIYEAHVRGFTRHPSSGIAPELRGTYAGFIEKIPHLVELGVEMVELLPVQHFDAQTGPLARPDLVNYWGYQPIALSAPHRGYSADRSLLGPVNEFRDLVKALHRAGIEVLLDVVFNHTAEDNEHGPTLCFKGIDNRVYYHLETGDESRYVNVSGVGNTLNANHTIVRRMILDHLRYWVEHMHVDGFRFDLASALARGRGAALLRDPPLLLDIDSDPILADTKIIAEPWDACGLYQVGTFVGNRWAVWNGRYRDTVRRFMRGDEGQVWDLADVISGSERVFGQPQRDPLRSVNFVTAHDGFTLNDLVSYQHKHNEDNGHDNNDGADDGDSWNCGVEGPTDDPEVLALRARQVRNFFTILLLSQGRPMISMGDELLRTQHGNNNAYCQDNEISWLDWRLAKDNGDVLRFVSSLMRLRHESILYEDRLLWALPGGTDIFWHGVQTGRPDWGHGSRSLAFELLHPDHDDRLYVAINAWEEPLTFEVPTPPPGQDWGRLIDTSRTSPEDFRNPPARLADASFLTVGAHSIGVLRTWRPSAGV